MTNPFENASPRPWTYHVREPGRYQPGAIQPADWIEDAAGNVVVENVGHIDGPLICAAVNSYEHQDENEGADLGLLSFLDVRKKLRERKL